jgi:KaiC/GvpD/RAD55 family RecA-like ATPase
MTIFNEYGVGFLDGDKNTIAYGYYDGRGRLAEVRTHKISDSPDKAAATEKNCKQVLFGMRQDVCLNVLLVITKTCLDAMSFRQCDYNINAAAIPNSDSFEWIDNCKEYISQFQKILVALPDEKEATKLAEELTHRFGSNIYKSRKIDFLGETSVNRIMQMYGSRETLKLIDKSVRYNSEYLVNIGDIDIVTPDETERFSSGFPQLDKLMGEIAMGTLTVLTAPTGQGKTTMTKSMLISAVKSGIKCMAYAGEGLTEEYKYNLMLTAGKNHLYETEDSNGNSVGNLSDDIIQKIEDVISDNIVLYKNCESNPAGSEMQNLLNAIKTAIVNRKVKFIVIDNLMTVVQKSSFGDIFAAQRNFIAELKDITIKYKVAVLIVAHMKKTDNPESCLNTDISGSSEIGNYADNILIYRKISGSKIGEEVNATVTLSKCRAHGENEKKSVGLYYFPASKTLEDENSLIIKEDLVDYFEKNGIKKIPDKGLAGTYSFDWVGTPF